jgi:hypothetical protein
MFGVKNFQVKTNPAPGGSVILISTITAGTCEDSDQSSCTAEGASFDTCDYVGQEPATSICRVEAHKSSGAEACIDKPARTGRGPVTLTCDLSSHIGDILYLSVVSNDTTDCKTTASICVTCDPSDPGYPDYGYKDGDGNPIDQCNNKIPSELR